MKIWIKPYYYLYNNYDGVIEKVEPEADPHVVLPNQPSDQHHVVVQQQVVAQPAPMTQPMPAQQPASIFETDAPTLVIPDPSANQQQM